MIIIINRRTYFFIIVIKPLTFKICMVFSLCKGGIMNLNQANEYAKKLFSSSWVQWVHEGSIPAETSAEKSENVLKGETSKHCAMCLNLNGCCFVVDKCPPQPLHPNCHCQTVNISSIIAQAQCPIEKFTKYTFVPSLIDDKKQLFELWGYDIMDSEYLKQEFERQAKLAYSVGDYELGLLDDFGQRINIKTTLKKKNKNEYITFSSGWMVYPNGKISLTTPYGRK